MKKLFIALLIIASAVGNVFSQSMTISGGNDNGLIICSQGYIYAWGKNMQSYGECLGVPSTDPNYNSNHMFLPGRVETNNLTFSQVTAGSGSFHYALSCHKLVYAWGDNTSFACGQGNLTTASSLSVPSPVLKGEVTKGYNEDGTPGGDYLGGVKWIAGSTSSGFAITEDNRCVMWGIPKWSGDLPIGVTNENELKEPIYIRDKNGDPIENVTHISGGDENVYMRTSDGELWALGPWNGNRNNKTINENYATKVQKDDGTPLTNIKMSAAGDQCGFAVTGDGFVWGWGDAWGGCSGQKGMSLKARKVNAGDYSKISGESFLTDVTQVIGGRGHGAAVTKEGYLLYWGVNDGTNGGVAPDPLAQSSTTEANPIFAFYCKPGTCDVRGDTVKDAVAISRGDNFDFMVNDKDEYFGWGINSDGQLGVGQGCDLYQCLTKIETIPCDIQDACPIVYMTDVKKCPGETIILNSGFTIPQNKEKSYYIEWYFNGNILNTSKIKKGASGNYIYDSSYLTDIYNNDEIEITEAGKYKVIAYYVGDNIPCDACAPDSIEITVTEMNMPIDTIINQVCTPEDTPFNPTTEEMNFQATVNSFYNATDDVQFAVFATPDPTDKDTLTITLDDGTTTKVYETTGNGGKISFTVTGSQINHDLGVGIEDNKDKPSKDTLYHVWVEDVTRLNTTLLPKTLPTTTTAYTAQWDAGYGQLVNVKSSSEIISFSVFVTNTENTDHEVEITPIIYKAGTEEYGNYIMGPLYQKGVKQTFPIAAGETKECIVKLNIVLPATAGRGAEYMISCEYKNDNCSLYLGDNGNPTLSGNDKTAYTTPVLDTEGFGISAIGNIVNKAAGSGMLLHNLAFGKMTDYDCGRIPLTVKRYCPPCNDPKELEITASETIKNDVDADYKKVVELCKESDELVLDIEPLEGKKDPNAKFDIHWYDENPLKSVAANAIEEDESGSATTLELKTDWAKVAGSADINKDVEKVYYVMVHDHEKPGCIHYDSIKVIAHPAPTDSLDWMEFCEGSLTTEPTFEIAGMTINWIDEPKNVVDLTGPTTGTGTTEYTYKYTVTDDETGCEGEEHTLTISVNKTGAPDVKKRITLLKDPSVKYNLSAAKNSVDTDCEIHWYASETATSEMTNTSIPLDKADTIKVWAEQYNTVTKCTSERVMVEIIINDAPVPEVIEESLCIGNEIPDLSEYVKVKDSDHTLNWYDDPTAAKGTGSTTAPSFKATAAGKYEFYVSQTNTKTDAESEKATLTITVHEVATLDLSANKTEYCINETAEKLTFKNNSDGDFTTAKWSKKSDMSDATATLTPTTDEKGDVTYYAQAEYTNKDAQKSYANTVCYGKIQDITITTNKTDIPTSETNFTVQYLKAEGEKNKSYKSLLDQDDKAVKAEAGHTLKWYDSNKKPLSAEPKPDYIENEAEGERRVKYWVSQVNSTTGCESELIKVEAIISSFPAPKVKAITLCQESEKLKTSFPLTATINTEGGFSESDYILIWYKEDPKANPNAEEFISIDLSKEDLSYDSSKELEKDFKYWVIQRYTGPGGGQSPTQELLVTLYSKPILKTSKPDPICLGGEVDLKDLYSISNRIYGKNYELEYLSSTGSKPKGSIATEHGRYKSRAWFELSSDEICRSEFEEVFVTVNELEVAIKGDNTTCPGIGVELNAVLTTKNMDANDTPNYSWNISPTGVTGQMETLYTSEEGLSKKGDKITVNLEVSMGACKNKKPVDAHIVTVDDPGVDGTIKFDEQYNTNSGKGTYTLSKNGIVEFDGCNSKVDVLFNVKQTEDEFTYENLETGVKKTGKFSNGEGNFDVKAGIYEVTYTNGCATSFKFEVIDRSLDISGSPSKWSVCEGTPLTIKIVNNDNTPFAYDPKKYKIEWQKDGNALPGYDTEVLYIPSTTPDDNGVYSYTVTSSGCVYHDKIAMGGSFTSKPKVKINESLLAKDGVYEAVRTTAKEITIPIIQSTGIDMAKLSNKIVWNEDGKEVNKGETLSLASVDSDHEYQVVIAKGEKGYDTEFCGTSLDIILKADARLSIKTILVDAEGKQTKDMCLNEEGTGFLIDTTGTGKILHPDKFTFKIVETIDGVKKDIDLAKKDDYLFAEISPKKSAKYDIVYKYEVGNQDSSKTSEITVHPAYEVEWDRDVRLCEGETGFIQITKAEPASEITLSWEPDECLKSGSKNGANVEAKTNSNSLLSKKELTLVASNGGICADKKFYPAFTIDKAIEGDIITPEFVCEGHTATLDASPFKATEYVWSSVEQLGEGVTMSGPSINVVSKPGYATYFVEMKRGACTKTSETTFEVRYAPKFDRIDSLSFRSVEIVLQSNTGTAPFQYIVDDNYDENVENPVKDNLEYGNHSVKIIDAAGCLIDSSFVTNAPGLEFPIHISPNNDGINDVFSIPTLREAYPDANIRIFDRWGKKLAEYKAGNSELDWDGTYKGSAMPTTDYWYEIEIKEIKKTYTGHFTLIRQ